MVVFYLLSVYDLTTVIDIVFLDLIYYDNEIG